jgi:signal transduction histidine kinase
MSVEIIGTWIAAFLTLCIFSFLYRDNPFFRFAEALFAGEPWLAAGGAAVLTSARTKAGIDLLWRDVRREVGLAALCSQFVAGVSHELKTPLTSIRMFADTLRLGRLAPGEARALTDAERSALLAEVARAERRATTSPERRASRGGAADLRAQPADAAPSARPGAALADPRSAGPGRAGVWSAAGCPAEAGQPQPGQRADACRNHTFF